MAATAPLNVPNPVDSNDRLSFTVFLAVALHATVILGITFTTLQREPSTHRMEVTLAQFRSQDQPDKADYLAQFNQAGSGTLDEKALTTTTEHSEYPDNILVEPIPAHQEATTVSNEPAPKVITSISALDPETALATPGEQQPDMDINPSIKKSILERSLEIASLEARLDQQRQMYAKRPRIKRLTSLSTKASVDAYYLNSWRRKIETIGNLNYPSEARKKRLFGDLRLLVALRPNGSVKDIHLLQSSGHKILDDAAVQIVRLAEPFAPFPDELRKTTDILEIIRTWQFRKNSSLRSM